MKGRTVDANGNGARSVVAAPSTARLPQGLGVVWRMNALRNGQSLSMICC